LSQIIETIQSSKKYGDFEILFQYVNEEPALVIRAHRFLAIRRRAWVITLDSAWKYVDTETGDHSEYMVEASARIADMILGSTDIRTRFRIAEAIVENLEDLINMKPYKAVKQDIAAEVNGTMTIGGKTYDIDVGMENTPNNLDQFVMPVEGDAASG
jgi:hypothetical protein